MGYDEATAKNLQFLMDPGMCSTVLRGCSGGDEHLEIVERLYLILVFAKNEGCVRVLGQKWGGG
jgi:hypothetical protein